MYTKVHSVTVYNSQHMETTQMPSTDEWINKLLYIHTMEYNSAIRRNEVLTHAITWLNFDNTVN